MNNMPKEMRIILVYFAIKYNGDWDKIYKALEDKEKLSLKDIADLEKLKQAMNWNIITIIDEDYPEELKGAFKPPFVLWFEGDRFLLDNKKISITGETLGKEEKGNIEKFVPEIIKSHTIVTTSSNARVDKEIHKNNTQPMIFVTNGGIDKVSFANKPTKKDLVISEWPFGVEPSENQLKNANRLVSALSSSLILISSKLEGPSRHLSVDFYNLEREIYCFPNGKGNIKLISQGAILINDIKDMVN